MNEEIVKTGRVKQKLQTRFEILKAAKALMHQEKKITLQDVAKKARVSRATMYRYFSNIDILFTEASLDIHHRTPDEICEDLDGMKLNDRIFHIQNYYNELAQDNEVGFRRYLSAVLAESVVSQKPLRGARRMDAISKALAPFKSQIDPETYHKLTCAASVLMGIDPLITCKDVCNLNDEESVETLRWTLEMVLKGLDLPAGKN